MPTEQYIYWCLGSPVQSRWTPKVGHLTDEGVVIGVESGGNLLRVPDNDFEMDAHPTSSICCQSPINTAT